MFLLRHSKMSLPDSETNSESEMKETYYIVKKRKRLKMKIRAISRFDIIGNLPLELAQNLFFHLTPLDLRSALSTCRKWKNIASGDYFWKRKCKSDNYLELTKASRSEVYESFANGSDNYWERVYIYNAVLHQNWLNREYNETVFDPQVRMPTIRYYDDDIIIMTSLINSEQIFVYNYNEKLVSFTLPHTVSRNCLINKSLNFIVYAERTDKLLFVLCITTGVCKLKLSLPVNIQNIVTDKNLIAVWLYDGSWQIVNILSGEVEYKTEIKDRLQCVCFYESLVAFGSYSGVIKIINWSNKLTTTLIHDKEIIKLMISGDYLISFCDNEICTWSLQSKRKLDIIGYIYQTETYDYHKSVLLDPRTLLLLSNGLNYLVGLLEAWDIVDNVVKYRIAVLEEQLLNDSIITNSHYIFTYYKTQTSDGDDKVKFKVWSQKTGKCVSKFTLRCDYRELLITNTKLAQVCYIYRYMYMYRHNRPTYPICRIHLQDFEKNINLEQLNRFYD